MQKKTKRCLGKFASIIVTLSSILTTACVQEVDVDRQIEAFSIGYYINDVAMAELVTEQFSASDYQSLELSGETVELLPISSMIRKAEPTIKSDEDFDAFLARFNCDYESAEDGFRPSSRGERCAPVDCEFTKSSFYNPLAQTLVYAPDTPMFDVGCYKLRKLSKILLIEKLRQSYDIDVVIDASPAISVDLAELSEQIKYIDANGEAFPDGKGVIYLDQIIKKANADLDLSLYDCDFESVNGAKTSSLPGCKDIRRCDSSQTAYVFIHAPYDMATSNPNDAACYELEKLKRITVKRRDPDLGYPSHPLDIVVDARLKSSIETNDFASTAYETVDIGEAKLTGIAISKLIRKAHPEIRTDSEFENFLSQYDCDYAAQDGFKVSNKCPVVDCSMTTQSYFSLTQNKLIYAASTPMANKNCYGISDPKAVLMTRKNSD